MSRDTTDFLHDLGHVTDLRVPPVEQVRRRAGSIRTARRRGRTGLGVGAVAAVLAVAGIVLPQNSDPRGGGSTRVTASFLGVVPAHAADGASANCLVSEVSTVDRSEWATTSPLDSMLALLPDSAVGQPLTDASASRADLRCPLPTPVAVLYATMPQLKGLTVWADVADPYSGEDGLRTLEVRGATGQLFRFSNGSLNLSWIASDGTRWLAEASGIDQDSLVQTLDGLALGDHPSSLGEVPDGWSAAPLPTPHDETTVYGWAVHYGPHGERLTGDGAGRSLDLSVGPAVDSPATLVARAAEAVTLTTVNGDVAVYSTDHGACLRWQDEQFAYELCGNGGLARLKGLAEQVERVTVDDPRVQDAADPVERPGEGW